MTKTPRLDSVKTTAKLTTLRAVRKMIRKGSTQRDIMMEILWLWEGPQIAERDVPRFASKLADDLMEISHSEPCSELLRAAIRSFADSIRF